MANDVITRLDAKQRIKYEQTSRQFIPTIQRVKFGNTAALAKKTPEADRLALIADRAAETWRTVHDVHWDCMTDATATEAGRLVRSAQHAKGRIQQVQRDYDAALDAAEQRLAALHSRIQNALKPPSSAGEAMLDAEARNLIRNAKDAAEAIALAKAYPRAVATAPASLLGINPDTYNAVKAEYLTATAPEDFEAFNDLRASIDSAFTATKALETEARGLIDFTTAEQLANHANREAA